MTSYIVSTVVIRSNEGFTLLSAFDILNCSLCRSYSQKLFRVDRILNLEMKFLYAAYNFFATPLEIIICHHHVLITQRSVLKKRIVNIVSVFLFYLATVLLKRRLWLRTFFRKYKTIIPKILQFLSLNIVVQKRRKKRRQEKIFSNL